MLVFAAIAITCWVCTLLATPHRPHRGHEIEELIYARLLGGQQRLALLALLVTMGGMLLWLITVRPSHSDPDVTALPQLGIPCALAPADPASCATMQPRVLLVREIQDYGRSTVVTTIAAPGTTGNRSTRP